jgi:hypothetical protein
VDSPHSRAGLLVREKANYKECVQMRKMAKSLVLILSLMAVSVSQAATLSVVGVGDLSKASNSDNNDSYGSKVGFGGGAVLDFHLMERTSFEVGGLYINRKLDDTTAGTITSSHAIQVPVLLRFYLHPMISIGVGGYWAHGVGNINNEDSNGNILSTGSYADNNTKVNDEGLVGSVAVRFPITQTMRLLIDARYNYGLTNVYTDPLSSGATSKDRDIQALVGFQFALGMMR